ncbi:MAG: tRNA lysidine(34) synthetase TilS [Gammaproteobacteria bacterium]|nr:tRNA lysidine(34) synthetase TilS [Gammaproteobacteria bacterium]
MGLFDRVVRQVSTSANFSAASLWQVLHDQLSVEKDSAVYVAFSGGLDSHVLLHALSGLASDYPFSLNAIHINHSLQPQSPAWAEHCQEVCGALSVALTIKTLSLDQKKGESLEALARDARYTALAECLPVGGICMTAQHRNDQSETLLLQLLRGAGVHGLAAMPASKVFFMGQLLRPLLAFTRQDLVDYAQRHKLVWVEDPSNQDNRFDRNFLRNEVLPNLRERWPGMDKSLSRSARHAASAATMLDDMARSDLLYCKASGNHFLPPCITCLNAHLLAELPVLHRVNALRYWVRMNGLSVPSDEQMQSVIRLLEASSGKGSVKWSAAVLRLDNNILWLCDNSDAVQTTNEFLDWVLPASLQFRNMVLRVTKVKGEGLAKSRLIGFTLKVSFRQGSELCRMPGDHGSKPLKTLFQDLSIPAWMRDNVPLVFLDDELLAVSSLWSNPHYLPGPDEEGYVISVHYKEA